jgi:hypothetical protein
MKKQVLTGLALLTLSLSSFADMEKLISNGSHSAFLGTGSIDHRLYEAYEGGSEENEYEKIHDIFTDAISVLLRDYPNEGDEVKRDAHAKSHGCVKAQFKVNNQFLPEKLKVGIFEKNISYDTWVRFSNNHSNSKLHDNIRDVRGMSLKLLNVGGEQILPDYTYAMTQDILMFGSPVFFIKNNSHYMSVLHGVNKKWGPLALNLLGDPMSIGPLASGFKRLAKEQDRIGKVTNPANLPYFSATPYRLGKKGPDSTAIKFGAYRVKCEAESFVKYVVDKKDETKVNYLSDTNNYTQERQPVCFNYWIQKIEDETDRVSEKVEDPSIDWTSPKIHVAVLKVEPQKFDTPGINQYCENLSFTPWHSLPEHRPLGRINRARGILYNVISEHRHRKNGVLRSEPFSLNEAH